MLLAHLLATTSPGDVAAELSLAKGVFLFKYIMCGHSAARRYCVVRCVHALLCAACMRSRTTRRACMRAAGTVMVLLLLLPA